MSKARGKAAGAILALVLVAVAFMPGLGPATSDQAVTFPLDPYPGFGRTAEAALRDDTIAFWEAYKQEVFVKACMENAGFQYLEDALYPGEVVQEIARSLGVAPELEGPIPLEVNDAYKASARPMPTVTT